MDLQEFQQKLIIDYSPYNAEHSDFKSFLNIHYSSYFSVKRITEAPRVLPIWLDMCPVNAKLFKLNEDILDDDVILECNTILEFELCSKYVNYLRLIHTVSVILVSEKYTSFKNTLSDSDIHNIFSGKIYRESYVNTNMNLIIEIEKIESKLKIRRKHKFINLGKQISDITQIKVCKSHMKVINLSDSPVTCIKQLGSALKKYAGYTVLKNKCRYDIYYNSSPGHKMSVTFVETEITIDCQIHQT
jgi:hypothetical protein